MGGELPGYRCHPKLAGAIGGPLAIAGLSPQLECLVVSGETELRRGICVFCGELVPRSQWPLNQCPKCRRSYKGKGVGVLPIPNEWKELEWYVSVNSNPASLIFDLGSAPTVTLLSRSNVLYPTIDRMLFASGCRSSERYFRKGWIGFTKLFRFYHCDRSALKSAVVSRAGGLFEDRFDPPSTSRPLAADLKDHSRPVGGCEVEVGPAIDPDRGLPLVYLGIWLDRNANAAIRSRLVGIEDYAIDNGAEIVNPLLGSEEAWGTERGRS